MNKDDLGPAQEDRSDARKRQPYNTPRLSEFGHLSVLTTGGAGSLAEGGAMIAGMKFP
jgi:hypothetical protein